MAVSRRGVDDKLLLFCSNCNSKKIVKNGHHHQGKLQFYCLTCNKYFYKDSAKGYPPTSIPFPVIAYLLYFRRKVPEFSNMRRYRNFVNHWLKYLKINEENVSRQTVHHWLKNYEKYLNKVINFEESRGFVRVRISKLYGRISPVEQFSYKYSLKILEGKFGKDYCFRLVRSDPVFFQELCDVISRFGVFGWEFLEGFRGGDSAGYRSSPVG
jgi:hypothetical protein